MLDPQLHGGSLLSGTTTTAVGGYVGVKQMQEQLRRVAFEFGKSNIDPAQYDGKLTLGTIIALANAAPVVGAQLHSALGSALNSALNFMGLIKAPIKKLPYGDTIIEFILSPWIVDEVYGAILGIIRLIPGGGGPASAIDKALTAAKSTLATAAAPIATALLAVKKRSSGGLGQTWTPPPPPVSKITSVVTATATPAIYTQATPTTTLAPNPPPGFTWVDNPPVPGHWERVRVGETPQPGPAGAYVEVRTGSGGGVNVTVAGPRETPLAPPQPGQPGIVRDHRTWAKGKEIVSADWGRARTYYGPCPKENLSQRDRDAWEAKKNHGPFGTSPIPSIITGDLRKKLEQLKVRYGTIAFLIFRGYDNARMGAFWDEQTQMLKIAVVPEPSSSKYPWDYAADAVSAAADAIGDAVSAGVDAIKDIAQDTWNWIAENADDVYRAIKKYGCAIVNNDIVVGVAAAGTGIVASPATSAAVVAGAQAGKAACTVLEVTELLYAIYKLLSMDIPKPPPLTTPTPPAPLPVKPLPGRVLLPLTPPVVPLAKPRYPAGSIAAYDVRLKRYRIAIPVGTQLQLRGIETFGTPLGAEASHFEVETTEFAPPMVVVTPLTTFQKQTGTLPAYKNPAFWAAVGVGTAAVGGGSYMLYRRRRGLTR